MKNLSLIILLLFNIVIVIINYKQKNDYKNLHTKLTVQYDILLSDYNSFIDKTYRYEGVKYNINNNATNILHKYANEYGTILIYRIPFPYCETCIVPVIKILQEFANENQINNILIVTSFPNMEEYNEFKQHTDNNQLNYINISELDLNINHKESEGSYTFIIQQSMKTESLFFNSKYNSRMFSIYLNTIKHKLKINESL